MSKFKKSKFKIGDIIRGTIIAMGAGNDSLAEVPCIGIVIPHDTTDFDKQGTIIISGPYRGCRFSYVDEDHFELVPEEELGHVSLL